MDWVAGSTSTDGPSLVSLLPQFDPDVQDVDIRSTMGLRPAIYLKHARLVQTM